MPMKTRSGWRRWWWMIAIVILLLFVIDRVLDAVIRVRLEQVIEKAAGPGYSVDVDRVRANLFQGTIQVERIVLWYDSTMADSVLTNERKGLLNIRAEKILVQDLSYLRLLFQGNLHVGRIEVRSPEIHRRFIPGNWVGDTTNSSANSSNLPLIDVDTVVIQGAHGSNSDITDSRPSSSITELDIRLGGVLIYATDDGPLQPRVRSAAINARQINLALPPLYDLHIDDIALYHPADEAHIQGLRLVPRENEQNYHKLVELEVDLFRLNVDTIGMRGLDVAMFLAENDLHVQQVRLAGVDMQVYRDKTMPDAPWVHKPLPTVALRKLGWSIRADTVLLRNGRVGYHERDTLDADFGKVVFADLNVDLYGVDNSDAFADEGGTLKVSASARIYETSTIKLELSAPWAADNGRFAVSAYLNSIPFTVFNQMTDSLLQVEASAGRILTMTMHMHGNDLTGKGTVDLEYEDLRITIRPRGSGGLKDKLLNAAANTVIRSNNLRSKGNYRQGEFVIERRRDRAIFNFLWNGLKSGAIDTVVPEMLRKKARNATSRKTDAKMAKLK
jgi:hypothetical protein